MFLKLEEGKNLTKSSKWSELWVFCDSIRWDEIFRCFELPSFKTSHAELCACLCEPVLLMLIWSYLLCERRTLLWSRFSNARGALDGCSTKCYRAWRYMSVCADDNIVDADFSQVHYVIRNASVFLQMHEYPGGFVVEVGDQRRRVGWTLQIETFEMQFSFIFMNVLSVSGQSFVMAHGGSHSWQTLATSDSAN